MVSLGHLFVLLVVHQRPSYNNYIRIKDDLRYEIRDVCSTQIYMT